MRGGDRLGGEFEACRSPLGVGDLEVDLARISFLGDGERLRDLLPSDFSLDRLRDIRSDLTFDVLLERDLRVSERERDLLLLERLRDLRDFSGELERDFLLDPERDFLLDPERDLRPDLEWERRLLRDRELQPKRFAC